jgi:signal transduction histidine kinase
VSIESEFVHGISMYGAALPLSRALENVIDNAVRHSPENGTVWVQQRLAPEHSGWLQCTILDSGPGFPSSEMERLFDPFFTTRPGGTGLGLAVARRVVEDHGGKLELSNGSTGGACVTFLLPRDRRTLNLDDITKSAELN